MNGVCLKLYMRQFQKHQGILLYEWLLEEAKKLNFPGGSAFISLASYGNHGQLHESHFYELSGGDLTVEVVFALSKKQIDEFLALLKKENLKLFFITFPIEYGYTG